MKFKFISFFNFNFILLFAEEKNCDCIEIVYQSNNSNDYSNIEVSRQSTDLCNEDSLFSSYLDSNQNISFVTTIIKCED